MSAYYYGAWTLLICILSVWISVAVVSYPVESAVVACGFMLYGWWRCGKE